MVVRDSILVVTEYLEKALSTKTVIGEAQQFGDLTLIPVVDVTFGFGGGGGEGTTQGNAGNGVGGGAGARVSAKAVMVIKGGEVTVLPLTRGSAMEKIVEAIPGLVDRLNCAKAAKPAEEKKPE
ncbi:MAG TPA: GerW family sporulation protein [Symbiobacteriaceae bacterium]|nr:GerW family sporulation protein [Symbiobacteriaceae bacterium]